MATKSWFTGETAAGMLLLLATALALLLANSSIASYYQLLLSTLVMFKAGTFEIAKPLLLWINDGLMVVFFFLVGLELKREFIEGGLADRRNIILPAAGAAGGMIVPALIYVYFNYDDPIALNGWAIPVATDIAFALGILALLGSRVPISIKLFLTSLAIFDDIGAILIIAFFYASKISLYALGVVLLCLPVLFALNRYNVTLRSPYILTGLIMWGALLKSGVHATLCGVILAMFIPMYSKSNSDDSPLKNMEHDLHGVVMFFVIPVFAFANAGVNLTGVGMEQLMHSVPVGISLGLFLGKQIGILGFCWLFIALKLTRLPDDMNWLNLYGTAALCGVGFTMSLFIGGLAFEESGVNFLFDERLGIILGSLASGILGYCLLRATLPEKISR